MNAIDKELWDTLYNGQRFSIEALHIIEVKKKGKGPDKKHFGEYKNDPGPYYDPQHLHVHVWKSSKHILNFIGPQDQCCSHVQYTDIKDGLFCSICHCEKKQTPFNFNIPNHVIKQKLSTRKARVETDTSNWKKIVAKLRYTMIYKESVLPWRKNMWRKLLPKINYMIIRNEAQFPWNISKNQIEKKLNPEYKLKWNNIIKKLEYTSKNQKLVYPLSKYKSLLLWPWQLTPYQKFKIAKPEYKESSIFINIKKFQDDYAIII